MPIVKVKSGTIELGWSEEARIAEIRFDSDTWATGRDAALMVDALTRWVAADGKPFGLLSDGGRLRGVDAEYRAIWSTFLKANREHCFIAFFNMGPMIRIAAEMFGIGTGLRLKTFGNEEDARTWLRAKGLSA